jgi:hypothetical protein
MVLTFLQWEAGEATRLEFFGQFTTPAIYSWIEKRIDPIEMRINFENAVSALLDQVEPEEIVSTFTEMIDSEKWNKAGKKSPPDIYICLQIFIEASYRLLLLQDISHMVLNGVSEKRMESLISDYSTDSGCFSEITQQRLMRQLEKIIQSKKEIINSK